MAASIVKSSFYVDDLLTEADNFDQADKMKQEVNFDIKIRRTTNN